MNPAYLALIQQLALTGAQLYASSKGKDLSGIMALAPLVGAVSNAFVRGSAVLKQAHDEGWTEEDIRWSGPFADIDAVLDELEKRMT